MGSISDSTGAPSTAYKIVFVGAGTTALAAAVALCQQPSNTYDIHIYEKRGYEIASNVAVSGIHLKPNSTKLLDAWGVNDFFDRGRVLYSTNLCRYADGKLLAGHSRPVDEIIGARSAETWYINRADLWTSLFDKAKELGTKFHFDVNVKTIDMQNSQLELGDGSTVPYELLIGSDGLHSRVRGILFPGPEYEAVPTSDVVYQISIPKETIFSHPPSEEAQSLQDLYNDHSFRLYCGPHRFIVAATSEQRSKLEMQIIMIDHEKSAEGPWTREVNDRKFIQSLVDGFEPSVRLAFSMAKSAWRWRLGEAPDLPDWASENGKVILLGDAAHGILPFAGLGAGQGIESAAVLAELISHISLTAPSSPSQLPRLAQTYKSLRTPRVVRCRDVTRTNGGIMSMPDGPEQEERDKVFATPPPQRDESSELVKRMSEGKFQAWVNSADVVEEARRAAEGWSVLKT